MRHCAPQPGERMDSERGLTDAGKKQAADMAAFLVRQVGRCDIVISSPFARAVETASIMAEELGCHVATTRMLEPDENPKAAWQEIERLAQASPDVLVVGHHPEIGQLADWLIDGAHIHFSHGSIALLVDKQMEWIVTPQLVEKLEGEQEIVEAARALVEAADPVAFTANVRRISKLEDGGELWRIDAGGKFTEAAGEYTYDEIEQKRWVLGSGGASGENCETCEENADMGWIDMNDTFLDTDGGDIDDAPAHPNCDCTVEQRTKRVRVDA